MTEAQAEGTHPGSLRGHLNPHGRGLDGWELGDSTCHERTLTGGRTCPSYRTPSRPGQSTVASRADRFARTPASPSPAPPCRSRATSPSMHHLATSPPRRPCAISPVPRALVRSRATTPLPAPCRRSGATYIARGNEREARDRTRERGQGPEARARGRNEGTVSPGWLRRPSRSRPPVRPDGGPGPGGRRCRPRAPPGGDRRRRSPSRPHPPGSP